MAWGSGKAFPRSTLSQEWCEGGQSSKHIGKALPAEGIADGEVLRWESAHEGDYALLIPEAFSHKGGSSCICSRYQYI